MTCSVEGCTMPHYCKGLCTKHYQRMRNHGSVADPRPSWEERFWAKVNKTDTCWVWTGADNGGGYGAAWDGRARKTRLAHRISYELTIGPIAEDLPLDHLCRRPHCVRPDHLEPVTPRENSTRGYAPNINAARQMAITSCLRGHVYDAENTRRDRLGRRNCRACSRLRRQDPGTYYATKRGRSELNVSGADR